jgi:hypothetical protein
MPFIIMVIKVLTQQEVWDILKDTKRIRQQNCGGRLLKGVETTQIPVVL